MMHRRAFVQVLATVAGLAAPVSGLRAQGRPRVEVWKDPNCGCCKDWIKHLESNGFDIRVNDSGNTAARARLGIPEPLGSCHTAQVGGYAIEGHVPAREIQRLLREQPQGIGLSVPGMPIGSPGMDGPAYGGRKDRYDVVLVRRDGRTQVYQSYNKS